MSRKRRKSIKLKINYLDHSEINKIKWDSIIEKSPNGLVYALSWYLDIISPGWDALIADDYNIIMPLPTKTRFGKKILFQPVFAHQLGVFAQQKLTESEIGLFISEASKIYSFIDIKLNNGNPAVNQKYCYPRQTQTLDLSKSYEDISAQYNRSLKSNLSKSGRTNFEYSICDKPAILIDAMKEMYNRKNIEGIKESDFVKLGKIIDYSIKNSSSKIYCASFQNQLCSAMFVLGWKNRLYTFYGTTKLGREKRSLVALLDHFIRENAGTNLILDFCGSNIPGVAEWNLGFAAQNHTYYGVQLNNLPLWVRWLKQIS